MKNLRFSLTLLLLTITPGGLGFHFVEDMPFFDALYMTVITISTVGFHEVKPLSTAGRVLTMTIISGGIMIAAYTIGTLVRILIEGEFKKTFGRRKVEKQISALKDHYIICGYGRIGSLICQELREYHMD